MYKQQNNFLWVFQFAYRLHHSTESAVLKVLSGIVNSLDMGIFGLQFILELSDAFDITDKVVWDLSEIATLAGRLQDQTYSVNLSIWTEYNILCNVS